MEGHLIHGYHPHLIADIRPGGQMSDRYTDFGLRLAASYLFHRMCRLFCFHVEKGLREKVKNKDLDLFQQKA